MKAKRSNTAVHDLAEELLDIDASDSEATAKVKTEPLDDKTQKSIDPISILSSQPVQPSNSSAKSQSGHSINLESSSTNTKRRNHDYEEKTTPTNLKIAPSLQMSENLRIAQKRIQGLEKELEQLRLENEQLMAAGETFRLKSDELMTQNSEMQNEVQHMESLHEQDIHLLKETMERQHNEIKDLKKKKEELENRIHSSVQKVRQREKELENRLELVKAEGGTLLRSKDDMILALKKQKDLDHSELEMLRSKNQELSKKIAHQADLHRRVVKALRLALGLMDDSNE